MKRNVPVDEIENKWMMKYKEEDRPTSLMKHIKWLEEIGFKNVDVVWKCYIMLFMEGIIISRRYHARFECPTAAYIIIGIFGYI